MIWCGDILGGKNLKHLEYFDKNCDHQEDDKFH